MLRDSLVRPVAGCLLALGISAGTAGTVFGQEPGWYPRVIAPSDMRPLIQSTPMELRPYRPLHFWGNTVRRSYYRGNPLPMPRDLLNASESVIREFPLPPPPTIFPATPFATRGWVNTP